MRSLTLVDPRESFVPPGPRPRVALTTDPRFSGGTGAAVAAEITALAGSVDLVFCALGTAMFRGDHLHPGIATALAATGVPLVRDPPVLRAETIVLHNPSCLRFDRTLHVRLACARLIVVTHENFLRPNGTESFDVAGCLDRIEAAAICGRRVLAPVSDHNRDTVRRWCASHGTAWEIAEDDWSNIFDLTPLAPAAQPRDRRGRHSRPGPEKFPSLALMEAHFPPAAERCIILGADSLMADSEGVPEHWDLRRFGATGVAEFLAEIDFFVYFTNPLWRESFGRVIAEAIAAGKLVITDPGTAAAFGDGVINSDGSDVDAIIARFMAAPQDYGAMVRRAQAGLARFAPDAVRARILPLIAGHGETRHALV
jgi:hypothetical protein